MIFSVIIPTMGRPEVLRQTVQSVVACSPHPFELLIVDGDPERSAAPVVEDFSGVAVKLTYVHSAPGLTRQRNEGMRCATGDVVVFLDDDVIVAPSVFSELEEVYADTSVIGATGRVVEANSKRIVGKHSRFRNVLPGGGREGAFTRYGYPRRLVHVDMARDTELMHGSFMSARLEVAREVGFDEHLPGYGLAEDEDFSYRLSRHGRIRYVPTATIQHLKMGHGSRDARAFGRQLVVNRAYLFRKNFPQTPAARAQFWMLIGLLIAHRAINREWQELRGLVEGSRESLRAERPTLSRGHGDGATTVLFLASHSRRGGSERYLENIVDRLGPDWVERVVCLEEGPLVTSLAARGARVDVLHTSGRVTSIMSSSRKFRTLVKQSRAAVIHANGVKAALVAALALAGTKVPIVWVKHDFSYDGILARTIASRCRFVVGVSKSVTEVFDEEARRIRVVHTGVPMPTIDRSAARRALIEVMGIQSHSPVLGLVGRLHPVKGHAVLLDVLPELMGRVRDVEVAIIGGADDAYPNYETSLRQRADELGVSRRVHWLGHRDDLGELLAGMDLIVMPSSAHSRGPGREGFPLVALEAMAAGTPVVGFDLGGLPEAVGNCGRVVPYGDGDRLRDSIVDVLSDRELADRLGRCGRERVERYFTLETMIRSLKDIYAEAAA